jgi:predicted phosphodiesterase
LHDRKLCEDIFPQFLTDVEPHHLACLGDITDQESMSQYVNEPGKHSNGLQDGLDCAHNVMGHWAASTPKDTLCELELGNHDIRVYKQVLTKIPELHGLRRAGTDDRLLDIGYMLNLEPAWNYVRHEDGTYPHEAINILGDPRAIAVHGDTARKGAGNTAHAYLYNDDYDLVLHGHDHRLAYVHRRSGSVIKVGVSVGCMTILSHGYNVLRGTDWQNGFATVEIFEDGTRAVDLATWRDNVLTWRGMRWHG